MNRDTRSSDRNLRLLRCLILGILTLGLAGTATDLLLLAHYEDTWQRIPLILLAAALVTLAWHVAAGSAASVRALRAVMLLLVAAAVTGGVLHFRASAEFHAELEPAARSWPLVLSVLRSKVPPVLAPAALLQLGLLGLAYTYRHPALRRGAAAGPPGASACTRTDSRC